jgi:hypothetical protein
MLDGRLDEVSTSDASSVFRHRNDEGLLSSSAPGEHFANLSITGDIVADQGNAQDHSSLLDLPDHAELLSFALADLEHLPGLQW